MKAVLYYAAAAGFKGVKDLPTAAAIAFAESSGNPSATNKNSNGSTDYGLWQINSVHGALLKQGEWSNPADNAKMAYKVYSDAGNSFKPWVTYKTGAYLKYMAQATASVAGSGAEALTGSDLLNDAAQSATDATGTVDSAISTADKLVDIYNMAYGAITSKNYWIRMAMFVAGGSMVTIGLLRISTLDNSVVGAAAKVGELVASKGASAASNAKKSATAAKSAVGNSATDTASAAANAAKGTVK